MRAVSITALQLDPDFEENYEKAIAEIVTQIKEEAHNLWTQIYPDYENEGLERILQAAIVMDLSTKIRKSVPS